MKKAIFVLGLKWLDKVNGNTYNNAVIYYDNGDSEAIGYEYGYDDDYYKNGYDFD